MATCIRQQNRRIFLGIMCFETALSGNTVVALALFRLRIVDATESIMLGTLYGIVCGIFLAAFYWGKL